MKEFKNMPVMVTEGNDGYEVYEYEDGFAMTTEFLGRLLGFKRPNEQMPRIYKRHKADLEPHRFVVTVTTKTKAGLLRLNAVNPQGGRPSNFYDLRGCEKFAAYAGTSHAKEVYGRLSNLRAKLEALRIERIEKSWFARRPWWTEVRERVMKGETFKEIAGAMGRSAASVRNAVRRMIEFGIMMPLRAAQALTGRAKLTVLDYGRKYYGDSRQQLLFGGDDAVTV